MLSGEDTFSLEYPYYWDENSSRTLEEYLGKYKPSMVQNDGTKPWLWVSKLDDPVKKVENVEEVEREAKVVLQETADKVEDIQNDESIPVNKKKGLKNKKELREATQAEATEKLKEIALRHGHVSGKWLIFAPPDKVDMIWSTIATSLIKGPLASTSAYRAKVATSPQDQTPHYQHVLCLYLPDVYDKDAVLDVMKVLLRRHGMNLMGVKTNLYTTIGLDSKHPSGIPSTIWKNTALMKDTEIKEMKDEYYKELEASKAAAAAEKTAEKATTTSGKPKLKRKAEEEDPFANDDSDEDEEPKKTPKAVKKMVQKKPVVRKPAVHTSDEDESEDEKERKAALAAMKVKSKSKPSTQAQARKRRNIAQDDDASDSEDGEQSKRKNVGRISGSK